MTENMKLFMEKVSKDSEWRNKVEEINRNYPDQEKNKEALIALAKTMGIELSEKDFAAPKQEELNEDELNTVSGGRIQNNYNIHKSRWEKTTDCFCLAGGGGTADKWQKTCACVIYGQGDATSDGYWDFDKKVVLRCCGLGEAKVLDW